MLIKSLQANHYLHELDKHTEIMDDWTLIYDQLSGGKFESQLQEVFFDGIHIFHEKIKPSTFQRGQGVKNALSLGLFTELSHPAQWMGKTVSSHEILSICDDGDILLRAPESSSFYSLTMPLDLLTVWDTEYEHLQSVSLLNIEQSESFYVNYFNIFNYMLNNPYILENNIARDQLKSDLVSITASFVQASGNNKQTLKLSTHRAKQVILTACDAIQANNHQFLSIEELCNITYTSRRTLQNCFEQITGQSPAAFMKKLRLNAVKRVLTNANCIQTIADVAMDWGFWHLSQFSVDYKKLFGESPSQTVLNYRFKNAIKSGLLV